jgi:hypothetical protein
LDRFSNNQVFRTIRPAAPARRASPGQRALSPPAISSVVAGGAVLGLRKTRAFIIFARRNCGVQKKSAGQAVRSTLYAGSTVVRTVRANKFYFFLVFGAVAMEAGCGQAPQLPNTRSRVPVPPMAGEKH